MDWTWTDLETRVHIVRFAPKGVLTILKHVFRVKRSPYLYSIINFLLPDVGCHSQPPIIWSAGSAEIGNLWTLSS